MAVTDAIIVGGGMAGLCCARRLHKSGASFILLEGSDGLGGRVRSDRTQGYVFDRGFHILLTSYPEVMAELDLEAMDAKPFYPGVMVWYGGRFHRVVQPWKRPFRAAEGVLNPIGGLVDKLRLMNLSRKGLAGSTEAVFSAPEGSILNWLRNTGFSDYMIDRFFRAFFGSILLDRELRSSSRMGDYYCRAYASGNAVLPARGISAIPEQLASVLPQSSIRLNSRVRALRERRVVLESGEEIPARVVVVAAEAGEAGRLLGDWTPVKHRGGTCVYFTARKAPWTEPLVALDGEGRGPVNSLCVMSKVSPHYAPAGRHLICANVVGDAPGKIVESAARVQLREWFGEQVDGWEHLRTYDLPKAMPDAPLTSMQGLPRAAKVRPGLYLCGDYTQHVSIDGAMRSGRLAAEAALSELGVG